MASGRRVLWWSISIGIAALTASLMIYGRTVDRHFARGSREVRAVVLSVEVKTYEEGFRRVGRRYVRINRSRTQRTVKYAYEADGQSHTGRFVTTAPMLKPPRNGDSIRIHYALDKPSLSRVRSEQFR